MLLEDYLIDIKYPILAIGLLSRIINKFFSEHYYEILRGNVDNKTLDEIISLVKVIQMIIFCMRLERKNAYLEIEPSYKDDFTYESVMFNDIF